MQKCADRGIGIYTIDIGTETENTALENISAKTHGSYNRGEITHIPILLVNTLVYTINGLTTYGTDSDTDDLLDIYEIEGVRTISGKLITTKADNEDTDGDHLTDYDELGQVYDLNVYIGQGVIKNCRFVIPKSDPTLPDTDGDGIRDDEDPYPKKSLYKETTIHSIYSGTTFLNIDGFPGGNQNWWSSRGDFSGYTDDIDHYLVSPAYRTIKHGCGVIAISDLEIFLAQNYGLHAIYEMPIPSYGVDGCISRQDYMRYVDYNRDNVYLNDFNGSPHGVRTYNILEGLKNYLMANYIIAPNVTYAASYVKEDVMDSIIWMIDNNLPIVCLYNSKSGNDELYFYKEAFHAIYDENYKEDNGCYSHYFTIIGYAKYYEDEMGVKYLLEIVSNNTIYFVNYDEYAKQLSYGCNVFLYHL